MADFNSYIFDWNYDSNVEKREMLFPLFKKVFGFETSDLKRFYASGFANPTYTPFTFFDEGSAIANVSMFDMPLIINDQKVSTAGIQSVMTDPEYRGKGLFRKLFEVMLTAIDLRYEASFLFTNIPELYTHYGFRTVQEYYFVAPYNNELGQSKPSLRKLDIFNNEDVSVIKKLFNHFSPISRIFAPLSHAPSFYLNMFDPILHKKLYYSDELKLIIVMEIENDTLRLYDLIGKELPKIEEIAASIKTSISQVEFHFHPDLFALKEFKAVPTSAQLMVRGDIQLPPHIKFPKTASF